ncbi:hypothetical protein AAF712_016827, partial [Marasmius tenuissimus]
AEVDAEVKEGEDLDAQLKTEGSEELDLSSDAEFGRETNTNEELDADLNQGIEAEAEGNEDLNDSVEFGLYNEFESDVNTSDDQLQRGHQNRGQWKGRTKSLQQLFRRGVYLRASTASTDVG